MRRPVDIILPDTGPLITLAVADRLDLLTTFERPVMIPDVIREGALAKPEGLGHAKLEDWFERTGHNQHQIIATPFIDVYKTLRASQDGRPRPNPTKGMGEATLMWVLANIEQLHDPGTICLVVTQDGRAGDAFPIDVHVLSTRSWLQGLQNLGVIQDASALIADVERAGRRPSPYSRDRRGEDAAGNKTEWVRQVKASRDSVDAGRDRPRADGRGPARASMRPVAPSRTSVELLVTLDEVVAAIEMIDNRKMLPEEHRVGIPVSELLSGAGRALTVRTGQAESPTMRGVMALALLKDGFGKQKYRKVVVDPEVATRDASQEARRRFDDLLSACLDTTRNRQARGHTDVPGRRAPDPGGLDDP